MIPRLAALLAATIVAFSAVPGIAQTVCGERAKLIDMLESRFAETVAAMGLTSNGAVIEVLASPSGSWSMLLTYPTGLTCMVASGEKWERLPVPIAGEVS